MKKTILFAFLFSSLLSQAQLDTMKVRTTLQIQDYAWLCSQNPDSNVVKSIKAKIPQNATWETPVTIDLPALVAVRWYSMVCFSPASEIAPRYAAIKTELSAKANIAYWIGMIDGQAATEFDRKRNAGLK